MCNKIKGNIFNFEMSNILPRNATICYIYIVAIYFIFVLRNVKIY